jgi:DNA primase
VTDNKTIKFLFLPTEHDPDSYVRELGAEAFEQEIHEAMPLSQFLLKEVSASTICRRRKAARACSSTPSPCCRP